MKMKLMILVICCMIAVFAIIGGSAIAYFTVEQTARNVITAGNVDLVIHEITSDGTDFPKEGMQIMPGDTVSKIVTVENIGGHPIYLRVKLTKSVDDKNLPADKCLILDINDNEWTYKEGYYYYNTPLNGGETTAALFTRVYFHGENINNDYLGASFTVAIDAYGVQSENNGDTVWDAYGWPEAEERS